MWLLAPDRVLIIIMEEMLALLRVIFHMKDKLITSATEMVNLKEIWPVNVNHFDLVFGQFTEKFILEQVF